MDNVVVSMGYWINWVTELWRYIADSWALQGLLAVIVINFAFQYIKIIKKVFR